MNAPAAMKEAIGELAGPGHLCLLTPGGEQQMNGITLTAKEAAGLINQMKPEAVIPTHYGSIVGKPEDADEFRRLVNPDIQVIVKL